MSPRWRRLWHVTAVYCAALIAVEATTPGPLADVDTAPANPLGLAMTGRLTDALAPVGGGDVLFAAFVALGLEASMLSDLLGLALLLGVPLSIGAAVRSRLRAGAALDEVTDHLRSAVGETVQPAGATVWLRGEGARR